jgi:hypothetical protein
MADNGTIVNKIKQSKLETIDLQQFHDETPVAELDIKDFLYEELMLKEELYRENIEQHNWSQYEGQYLRVYCSTDAIVATWAYMLVATYAQPYAEEVFFGTEESMRFELFRRNMSSLEWGEYKDGFVLLKGCSDIKVPEQVYVLATQKLLNAGVKKLMYGEACSNVPIYKQPRKSRQDS